jgi:Zn-dependent protease
MIFVFLDFLDISLFAAIVFFSAIVTALILGISFHEFSHAYIADTLGDGLPRRMGRVTLNPIAHLEPLGTVMMLIIGIGWGKPVPVNPYNTRNPKFALGATAFAGPFSNFAVAAIAGLPIKLELIPWTSPFDKFTAALLSQNGWQLEDYLSIYLSAIALFSIILGVFNLIPIAPLDGFKVAVGFLPSGISEAFARLEPYGPAVLIILLVLPFLTGTFLLFEIMRPFIEVFSDLFVGEGTIDF